GGCVETNHFEGSRPWARLARSVSISRSRFFKSTAWTPVARWRSASALAARSCWSSSRRCRPASSALMRVRPHIIGAASLKRSATLEAAAAELRESLSEAQQKRCQRRCRNLRSSHAAVDAICGEEVRTAAVRLDNMCDGPLTAQILAPPCGWRLAEMALIEVLEAAERT